MPNQQTKKDVIETLKRGFWLVYSILALVALIYLGRRFWDDKVTATIVIILTGICLALVPSAIKVLRGQTASSAQTGTTATTAAPTTIETLRTKRDEKTELDPQIEEAQSTLRNISEAEVKKREELDALISFKLKDSKSLAEAIKKIEEDELKAMIGAAKKAAKESPKTEGFSFSEIILTYLIVIVGSLWAIDYAPHARWFQGSILFLFLIIFLAKGLVIIQPVQFGVVTRFGMRLKGYLSEGGPYPIIPWIDSVEYIDYKIDTDSVDVIVTTGGKKTATDKKLGKATITIKGNLRKRPSPDVPNSKGTVLFLEVNFETITEGLKGSIASALGEVAGVSSVDDFIENRAALDLLINCTLRLSEPPHLKLEWQPEDRLRKYAEHADNIEELVANEKGATSAVEKEYGIEVVAWDLIDVAFSDNVKQAIEKQRIAEGTADAAEELNSRRRELLKIAEAEAGPENWKIPAVRDSATAGIDVALGLREKARVSVNTTEVRGKGGLLGAVASKFLSKEDDSGKKKGD